MSILWLLIGLLAGLVLGSIYNVWVKKGLDDLKAEIESLRKRL